MKHAKEQIVDREVYKLERRQADERDKEGGRERKVTLSRISAREQLAEIENPPQARIKI